MCAIFILYFVLFLFVTCFGWNFSAIVVVVVVSVVVVLVSVVVALVVVEKGGRGLFRCNYD
jgi:uncharacterized membrane protein